MIPTHIYIVQFWGGDYLDKACIHYVSYSLERARNYILSIDNCRDRYSIIEYPIDEDFGDRDLFEEMRSRFGFWARLHSTDKYEINVDCFE